jgi:hypothetical protein
LSRQAIVQLPVAPEIAHGFLNYFPRQPQA